MGANMKTLSALLMVSVAMAATPAEMAIESAKAEIVKHSDYAPSYNALAMAYVMRADQTADAQFYAKAEETLKRCFALAPDLYEAKKTAISILLGRHEYAKALESATKLNKQTPDDVAVYGYLVDADVALGNYKDAVTAAQWMLDLRPGNVPGLSHAGTLRELYGNLAGALEIMQTAYGSLPMADTADRAAILTRIAHLNLSMGEPSKAERAASQALEIFPDYHAALAELARVQVAQKKYDQAVELLTKLAGAAPRGEYLYALAEALELAGQTDQAKKAFAAFERYALAATNRSDNSNHELVAYYVDHAQQPARALEVARRELERRKDVFTLDWYAWALAANRQYEAADAQMRKLPIPANDPQIVAHAKFIAERLNAASGTAAAAR
jgi:tetratricopeptide (TPR) repeat protein